MKRTTHFLMLLCALALAFTNCKKVEGPKGDTGPAGPAGPTGNANVQTYDFTASSWKWDDSEKWRIAEFTVPALTATVLSKGCAVMLYQKSGTQYIALPITQNISSTVQENDWFVYDVNYLAIVIEKTDLSDPNPPSFNYRLVVIPSAARGINLQDYAAVKTAFNLAD